MSTNLLRTNSHEHFCYTVLFFPFFHQFHFVHAFTHIHAHKQRHTQILVSDEKLNFYRSSANKKKNNQPIEWPIHLFVLFGCSSSPVVVIFEWARKIFDFLNWTNNRNNSEWSPSEKIFEIFSNITFSCMFFWLERPVCRNSLYVY